MNSLPGRIGRVAAKTDDSFANFAARVGQGANPLLAASTYAPSLLSRNRALLDAMYRGSWVVGQAVDVVAEDMTRAGWTVTATMDPEDMARLDRAAVALGLADALCDGLRWARLYGGAIGFIMVDGQRPETPLNPDRVGRGDFRGVLPLDRWTVVPSTERIADLGPDFGRPEYYTLWGDDRFAANAQRIHHSRAIRFEGRPLPHWQRIAEQDWGMSVIERMHDRLVAFDSGTMGAAQLLFKAHLRTISVKDLRTTIAAGGAAMEGVVKMFDMIRQLQSNEGLTVLDAEDTFAAHSYGFSGLSDVLLQLGQQIAGATEIPLVRLFGQSPAGLNATGDGDIRLYYDGISAKQERSLRRPVAKVLDLLHRSELGRPPEGDLHFAFNPLWQTSATERADNAQKVTQTVVNAVEALGLPPALALRELRQSSDATGVWSNISDAMIAEASEEMPPPPEAAPVPDGADPLDADGSEKEGA